MPLGYHAGSLWLHDPPTAVKLLSDMGYDTVVVRPRRGSLSVFEDAFASQWACLRDAARESACRLIVDTEAAFVADPFLPTLPSLASPGKDADWTESWIHRWIQVVSGSDPLPILTLASGRGDCENPESDLEVLADRLGRLRDAATESHVQLAIRPASQHLIRSVPAFERLLQWLEPSQHGSASIGLAADVAEMVHQGEVPILERLERVRDHLCLVYVADPQFDASASPETPTLEGPTVQNAVSSRMPGSWDQPFGEGALDLPRLIRGLTHALPATPLIFRAEKQASAGLAHAKKALSQAEADIRKLT